MVPDYTKKQFYLRFTTYLNLKIQFDLYISKPRNPIKILK